MLLANVLQSAGQAATYSGNILLVVAIASAVIGALVAVYGALVGAKAYDTALSTGATAAEAGRRAAVATADAGGKFYQFVKGKRTYLFTLAGALTGAGWWCAVHAQPVVPQSISFDFTAIPPGEYQSIALIVSSLSIFFLRAAYANATAEQKAKMASVESLLTQAIKGYDEIKGMIPNSSKFDGIEDQLKKFNDQVAKIVNPPATSAT